MNGFAATAIVNTALIILIGFAIYITGTVFPLLALFFLMSHKGPEKG